MYYVYKDYQGSIIAASDVSGNITEFSYDPWGRRRNPNNWTDYNVSQADQLGAYNTILFTRGYTGHEHIDDYGLINMNGRIYDARLGRFLSPDNYVQAAGFTQSYNRYSYCLNNPLKYTDPSGWEATDDIPVRSAGIIGYTANVLPLYTVTEAEAYMNDIIHRMSGGSGATNYNPAYMGGWDTYDVASNSFGNPSWNGSFAGQVMAAYDRQTVGTFASYHVGENGLVKDAETDNYVVIGDGNGNGAILVGSYATRFRGVVNSMARVAAGAGTGEWHAPMLAERTYVSDPLEILKLMFIIIIKE